MNRRKRRMFYRSSTVQYMSAFVILTMALFTLGAIAVN